METKYDLKHLRLMENDNPFAKYGPVGFCGYLQDEYGIFFNNGCWPDLTEFTFLKETQHLRNVKMIMATLLVLMDSSSMNVVVIIFY